MPGIKIDLTPNPYKESPESKLKLAYIPIIEVFLVCNHKIGKSVKCYIDTGSIVNIFPQEYATTFLGFSDKTLRARGKEIEILGVGGIKAKGYGYLCTIHHPNFRFENVYVFFVGDQRYPLLGRVGFMDKFNKITFNESEKTVELIL